MTKYKAVLVIQDSDAPSICINTEEEKCAIDIEKLWSDVANTTCRLLTNGRSVSHHRVQSCAFFIAALTSGQRFPPLLIKGCTVHLETKYKIYKEKYSQKVCCDVAAMFFISNWTKNRLNVKHSFVTFILPLFCSLEGFWAGGFWMCGNRVYNICGNASWYSTPVSLVQGFCSSINCFLGSLRLTHAVHADTPSLWPTENTTVQENSNSVFKPFTSLVLWLIPLNMTASVI